ncbi:MAG: hypothetical protein IPF66_22770 [Holophagales bacterium]|nr:hypothetical protein [Holophagales bacterium]
MTSATGARMVKEAQRTAPPHAASTAAKLPPRSRVKRPELSLSATSASASVHVPEARRAFVSPEEYPSHAWGSIPRRPRVSPAWSWQSAEAPQSCSKTVGSRASSSKDQASARGSLRLRRASASTSPGRRSTRSRPMPR